MGPLSAPEARGSARLALGLSFAQRHGVLLIRVGGLAVLARLLPPDQHGVFAAAIALNNLCVWASELGMQQYVIRAPVLTPAVHRNALGLSLTAAFCIATILLGICILPPAGWISTEFRQALAVLAVMLPLQSCNVVASAVLQRQLRFAPALSANLFGAVMNNGVAILLAVQGFGAISMAIGNAVDTLAIFIGLSLFQPVLRPTLAGWRDAFRAGRSFAAVNLLSDISTSLGSLIVSSMLGFGAAGLLARAQTVAWIFHRAVLDAIYPVVLPVIALRLRDGVPVGPLYVRQASYLAVIGWPFFLALALLAGPLVELMLGPGWDAAVPLVQVLAIDGLFLPLAGLLMPYLAAFGLLDRFLPIQAGLQGGKILLTALACLHSVEAACAVAILETVVRVACVQALFLRAFDYGLRPLGAALLRCLPPTLACLAGPAIVLAWPGVALPPWLTLTMAVLIGAPLWLAAILLARHPLREEFSRVLQLVQARRAASQAGRARLATHPVQGPTT
jgi:O-antigen/teichoic acid export membrane protein